MMTEMDIVDINSFRNVFSLFGIIYLFFVCILPFFIIGFVRTLSLNIFLFVAGMAFVVCSQEGDDSSALSSGWKIRSFNPYGQSMDKSVQRMTEEAWEYDVEHSHIEMFAMNDKNSHDYVCSVWVFNPSSLWMCPAIFALPVLFGLFVIFSLFKTSFQRET